MLRTLRIDELPQIFNILKWQMSWIGPRPEAEVLSVWYTSEIPFYRYRHVVKPGISGWAQVNQGHVAEVDEVHRKLQYDFYYIKYFSPWLDLLILFRTIKTMLTGWGRASGAVSRIARNRPAARQSATTAIIAPGAMVQPVRSTSS